MLAHWVLLPNHSPSNNHLLKAHLLKGHLKAHLLKAHLLKAHLRSNPLSTSKDEVSRLGFLNTLLTLTADTGFPHTSASTHMEGPKAFLRVTQDLSTDLRLAGILHLDKASHMDYLLT